MENVYLNTLIGALYCTYCMYSRSIYIPVSFQKRSVLNSKDHWQRQRVVVHEERRRYNSTKVWKFEWVVITWFQSTSLIITSHLSTLTSLVAPHSKGQTINMSSHPAWRFRVLLFLSACVSSLSIDASSLLVHQNLEQVTAQRAGYREKLGKCTCLLVQLPEVPIFLIFDVLGPPDELRVEKELVLTAWRTGQWSVSCGRMETRASCSPHLEMVCCMPAKTLGRKYILGFAWGLLSGRGPQILFTDIACITFNNERAWPSSEGGLPTLMVLVKRDERKWVRT